MQLATGLPETLLMSDVDRYVDRLYEPIVKELNLTCVKTQWHRYAVDLNRLPDDVDQASVVGSTNAAGTFSQGLHWVKTMDDEILMKEPIPMHVHNTLVTRYFEPFHADVRETYIFFASTGP